MVIITQPTLRILYKIYIDSTNEKALVIVYLNKIVSR